MNRSNAKASHRRVSELLPWYLNGTLEGPELDRVESHLRTCESCQIALAAEQRLAHMLRTSEELAFSPERALDRMRERLATDDTHDGPETTPDWMARLRAVAAPVRWALVAQFLIIAVLGVAVLRLDHEPAPYRTLSTPSEGDTSEVTSLRLVFDATASEGDLRALLVETGCTIVAGPSRFGVYTVAVSPRDVHSTLDTLRSSPLVTFVEPGLPQP